MEHFRQLIKKCTVGEYTFDVVTNRQIVLDGFKEFPKLWETVIKSKDVSKNGDFASDIYAFEETLNKNDYLVNSIADYVAFVLPKMVEEAGSTLDCAKFLEYCRENDVDEEFNNAIFEFAMMGFTDGRGEKKPKVKVVLK